MEIFEILDFLFVASEYHTQLQKHYTVDFCYLEPHGIHMVQDIQGKIIVIH